jgi:hypothetical protein
VVIASVMIFLAQAMKIQGASGALVDPAGRTYKLSDLGQQGSKQALNAVGNKALEGKFSHFICFAGFSSWAKFHTASVEVKAITVIFPPDLHIIL